MIPGFGIIVSLVCLTQMCIGNRREDFGGKYYSQHHAQSLDDLIKRWEYDTPDWVKLKERPEVLIYYPSVPEDVNRRQNPNINSNWRPGLTWSKPSDENRFQNMPPPLPLTRPRNPWIPPVIEPSNPRISRQSPPNLRECLRSCTVTSEYNPVCGTNNVTYANPGRLICAQDCGVDVTVRKRVSCTVRDGIDEGNTAPRPPVVNRPRPSVVPGQFWSREVQACVAECPGRGQVSPVCGTDGVTYANSEHLLCAQMCGADVRARQLSACSDTNNFVNNVQNDFNAGNGFQEAPQNNQFDPTINSRNPENNLGPSPPTNNFGATESYTVPPHLRHCIRTCPVTLEQNPVCGTNGVVYNNPSHMTCARICGIDVHVQPMTVCRPSSTSSISTTTTQVSTTQSQLDCVASCPITSEESPVCGTNGVTYKNPAHLQCIKRCGVDIDVRSFSSCQFVVQNTTSTSAPKVITTTLKASTNKHVTESTTQATVPPTEAILANSTISKNILNSIFTKKPVVDTTSESIIPDEFIRIND